MFKKLTKHTSLFILAEFMIFNFPAILVRNNVISSDTSANNVSDNDLDACPNVTIGIGEFYLLPNISVFIRQYNLTLNEEFYVIQNDTVTFCKQYADGRNKLETLRSVDCLTKLGFIISVISLVIQMIIFWFVCDLRNLSFCNKLSSGIILVSLALFNVYPQTGQLETDKYYENPMLTHFYLLASFSWMSIISSDAFLYFSKYVLSLHIFDARVINRDHIFNNLFPALILTTYMYPEILCINIIPESYRPKLKEGWCWLMLKSPSQSKLLGYVLAFMTINACMHYCRRFGFMSKRSAKKFRKKDRSDHKCVFVVSIAAYVIFFIGALAEIYTMSWMWNLFIFFFVIEIVISILITMSYVGTTFIKLIAIALPQPLRPSPVKRFLEYMLGSERK